MIRRAAFGGVLLALVAVGPAVPVSGAKQTPPATYSDAGIEAQLVRIYADKLETL